MSKLCYYHSFQKFKIKANLHCKMSQNEKFVNRPRLIKPTYHYCLVYVSIKLQMYLSSLSNYAKHCCPVTTAALHSKALM